MFLSAQCGRGLSLCLRGGSQLRPHRLAAGGTMGQKTLDAFVAKRPKLSHAQSTAAAHGPAEPSAAAPVNPPEAEPRPAVEATAAAVAAPPAADGSAAIEPQPARNEGEAGTSSAEDQATKLQRLRAHANRCVAERGRGFHCSRSAPGLWLEYGACSHGVRLSVCHPLCNA